MENCRFAWRVSGKRKSKERERASKRNRDWDVTWNTEWNHRRGEQMSQMGWVVIFAVSGSTIPDIGVSIMFGLRLVTLLPWSLIRCLSKNIFILVLFRNIEHPCFRLNRRNAFDKNGISSHNDHRNRNKVQKWSFVSWCNNVDSVIFKGLLVNGCINVVITTIEKRFGLRSSQTGLVASGYDIASFFVLVPVTYFGGRSNASKPRFIGIGMIVMGLGSLVFSLPHFLVGSYRATSVEANVCLTESNANTVSTSVFFSLSLWKLNEFCGLFVVENARQLFINTKK